MGAPAPKRHGTLHWRRSNPRLDSVIFEAASKGVLLTLKRPRGLGVSNKLTLTVDSRGQYRTRAPYVPASGLHVPVRAARVYARAAYYAGSLAAPSSPWPGTLRLPLARGY
jgi:hypothetical protein